MASSEPGETIGPYTLREPLGRGGMGVVYRAVDARTGQEVALKLLLAVADERARRRQLLEARALTRLRHRSVVSLLDAGEERGRPWLALELVRGRSLQERLDREGALAPKDAARLVQSVAAGLAHAHREGILHRDLKPGNVLLPDDGGPPKLTDFGLAGFTFDLSQSRLTRSGVLQGSPGYWSPEQAAGQPDAIGPATDVYGLGAVLYAALTRRPPIEGESLPEVLTATANLRPEPPGADPALDAIALRCLEKAPGDRYPSVAALERELLRYLAGPGPRRRRGPLVVAALVGAAALAGAALALTSLLTRSGAPTTTPPTPTPPTADVFSATGVQILSGLAGRSLFEKRVEGEAVRARQEAVVHESRGLAKAKLGDLQGAIKDLDRAIELDPRRALAYVNRGAARAEIGDNLGAITDFDRAIELDPRDARGYVSRGAARVKFGDYQGAITDLDRAIELDPRGALAYVNRGVAREQLGDLQGAITDYDQAIALDPRDARAFLNRGTVRENLGDHQGALRDFDLAIELDPRGARTHVNRGLARASLGDLQGALQDLDRALELDPRDSVAQVNRGLARENLGDLQGALQDYDRALELDPRGARVYANRGRVRASLGDHQGALQDYDSAIAIDPRSGAAYADRGLARERLGDDAGACADWDTALRLEPSASWAAAVTRSSAAARARLERR